MTQQSNISQAEPKLTNLQGRPYANLDWVLSKAHKEGVKSLETELLQYPTEGNSWCAIFRARVELKSGSVYTGHGDATPKNVGKNIVKHLIRMAETRAIGRALRFAVNAPTLIEELAEEDKRQMQSAPNFSQRGNV